MTRLLTILAALAALALTTGAPRAAELGDDGLHKQPWFRTTFLDLREDLEEARAEGKRFLVIIEQRGCIYCKQMHEEVFPDPEVKALIEDNYFVVQLNMFGDIEVTDFDGTAMSEKEIAQRWGAMFTPTMIFFPEEVGEGLTASQAAVATMPGAFEQDMTVDILTWVLEKGYLGDESFQSYHGRMVLERKG